MLTLQRRRLFKGGDELNVTQFPLAGTNLWHLQPRAHAPSQTGPQACWHRCAARISGSGAVAGATGSCLCCLSNVGKRSRSESRSRSHTCVLACSRSQPLNPDELRSGRWTCTSVTSQESKKARESERSGTSPLGASPHALSLCAFPPHPPPSLPPSLPS